MNKFRLLGFLFLGLVAPWVIAEEESSSFFSKVAIQEIRILQVFRTRVLFSDGNQESIVKLGQTIASSAWVLKYCHPNRIVLESKDKSQVRIFIKQDSGEYVLKIYDPLPRVKS